MKIVLIHWLIKHKFEEQFKSNWNNMTLTGEPGFYGEILTQIDETGTDPKFQTFAIESPRYSTFINIGFWESIDDFNNAVGKYIPEATLTKIDGVQKYTIHLNDFEFKLRERVVMDKVCYRKGTLDFPAPDLIK